MDRSQTLRIVSDADDDDDDDRDFEINKDHDHEDFESVEEITTMRGKAEDTYNKHHDVYDEDEEEEVNSEEYLFERGNINKPSKKKEDPFADRERTSIMYEKSEDDDYVYKDINKPSKKKEDPFADRERTGITYKKSEDDDDDDVYKDNIHETFTENVEDSIKHEEDEDEEQGESRASMVEGEKDISSAVLSASGM